MNIKVLSIVFIGFDSKSFTMPRMINVIAFVALLCGSLNQQNTKEVNYVSNEMANTGSLSWYPLVAFTDNDVDDTSALSLGFSFEGQKVLSQNQLAVSAEFVFAGETDAEFVDKITGLRTDKDFDLNFLNLGVSKRFSLLENGDNDKYLKLSIGPSFFLSNDIAGNRFALNWKASMCYDYGRFHFESGFFGVITSSSTEIDDADLELADFYGLYLSAGLYF